MSAVKPVKLNLDGKEREFLLDLNAWIDLEEETGKDFNEIGELFSSGKVDLKIVRALVWAGLKQFDEEMTIQKAGKMISLANINVVFDQILPAITKHMPEQKEGDDYPNPPAKKSQSTKSGRSASSRSD